MKAEGLRAAWATGELGVSLCTGDVWLRPVIAVEVDVLGDEGIERQRGEVLHFARHDDLEHHRPWLEARARRSFADGRDLWDRRAESFPHLEFCREVEKQLARLHGSSAELGQIVRRLYELDQAFASWDRRPIHKSFAPSKCTPETPQTLEEEADDHTATRASGARSLFSWHVRFTPAQGRIFFDGDPDAGRGIIGYIGIKKGGRLT